MVTEEHERDRMPTLIRIHEFTEWRQPYGQPARVRQSTAGRAALSQNHNLTETSMTDG